MNRWRSVARRWGAALLLLVLFWTASQIASRVPQVVALGTSVHTLGLGDYSADSLTSLAPLSMQVLGEARADAATPSAGTPSASTTAAAPADPDPDPDAHAHARADANPNARTCGDYRDGRVQLDRRSDFGCDRLVESRRSNDDHEWDRWLHLLECDPWHLHASRQRCA